MATSEHDVPRRMTLEEFQRLPESDEFLYELDAGLLVREPRPARAHGTAVILLGKHLADYALEHGGVVTTETGYVLGEDPDTLRGPDVAYSRRDPAPYGGGPDGYISGAPDLAVEVLSPSNRWTDIRRKIDQYFAAGARMGLDRGPPVEVGHRPPVRRQQPHHQPRRQSRRRRRPPRSPASRRRAVPLLTGGKCRGWIPGAPAVCCVLRNPDPS
jgi:Uma2 family endonuclease